MYWDIKNKDAFWALVYYKDKLVYISKIVPTLKIE